MTTKRVPRLASNVYQATQRALTNIWYGEPAPISEAAEVKEAPESDVIEALSAYVLLIIEALGERFDQHPYFRRYEQRLYEELATKAKELPTLRAEVEALRIEYGELARECGTLRHENARLTTQRKTMRTRIANHEAMMADLTRQFEMAVKRDLPKRNASETTA